MAKNPERSPEIPPVAVQLQGLKNSFYAKSGQLTAEFETIFANLVQALAQQQAQILEQQKEFNRLRIENQTLAENLKIKKGPTKESETSPKK